jgi:cellulose synthase/poly-beta-1,6-N-acetylglucosamine synthase-like glycosyltransferase
MLVIYTVASRVGLRSGPLRRHRERALHVLRSVDDLFVVYVIPCLNEGRVISDTIDHLLTGESSERFAVMIVDDGSDDDTAELVRAVRSPKVRLFQRTLPEARKGKGAALNAAFRYLCSSDDFGARNADDVIVAVLDADGRLQPNATDAVLPVFADDRVGAVQIGVRMYNADASLLARFQDMEFVVFTEIFQRARRRLGTVGLGGNGQYVRLSALQSLGGAPWSDCLTEDLDLGIRLRLAGWRSEYLGDQVVEQQAVTSLSKFVRQRTRWFQGHLQCLRLVPSILRSDLSFGAMADLCWHLASPIAILLMSVTSIPFLSWLVIASVSALANGSADTEVWAVVGRFAVITFAPSLIYGSIYWTRTRTLPLWRSVVLAFGFVGFGFLWVAAGWRAVARIVRKQVSWAKTERTVEAASRDEDHSRVAA